MRSKLSIFTVVALVAAASPSPLRADELTAREILDRMEEVYATCRSYRDSGAVYKGGEKLCEFTTAFKRPRRLRFAFKSVFGLKHAVMCDGGDLWLTMESDLPDEIEDEYLEMPSGQLAIAGATGISGGAAMVVPPLLGFGGMIPMMTQALSEPVELGEALRDGFSCFRIEGGFSFSTIVLWIDKSSFVLRRVEHTAGPMTGDLSVGLHPRTPPVHVGRLESASGIHLTRGPRHSTCGRSGVSRG